MKSQNTIRGISHGLVLAILAACSQTDGSTVPAPSSRPAQVSMDASAWQFQYSTNLPKNPTAVSATAWKFDVPLNPKNMDGVHYLVTTSPILSKKNILTMAGAIIVGSGTTFVPLVGSGQIDTSTSPASCGVYVEEAGDALSGWSDQGNAVIDGNNYAYYRWWSHSGRIVLASGNFSVTTDFTDLADWSSVFGEFANAATSTEAGSPVTPRQGFAQALANPTYIGITCGGEFLGHGVIAKGNGPATFQMNSFFVR